jgi:hypothetical protein
MPYDIREEEGVFAVYRLPYPGEKGGEEKVAEMDEQENAEMFVEFAQRKEKTPPMRAPMAMETEEVEEEEMEA